MKTLAPLVILGLLLGSLALVTHLTARGSSGGVTGSAATGRGAVLVAAEAPAIDSTSSTVLSAVTRAATTEQLQALLASGEVNVIVLDDSARNTLSKDFLRARLHEGISLIGLNISLADLRRISGFEEAVLANQLDPQRSPKIAEPSSPPDGAFYSFVGLNPAGSEVRRFGQGQRSFAGNLFAADLENHASTRFYGHGADVR